MTVAPRAPASAANPPPAAPLPPPAGSGPGAGAVRPAVEAFLATLALGLLLPAGLALLARFGPERAPDWWPAALRPGLLYAAMGLALIWAVRLRPPDAGWRRLAGEAGAAVRTVGAVAAGAGLADLLLTPLVPAEGGGPAGLTVEGAVQSLLLALFAGALGALVYAPARALRLAWAAWGRLRRRRLLWALTHAQLVVILSVALALAASLTAADLRSRAARGDPFHTARSRDSGEALSQVLDRVAVVGSFLVLSSTTLAIVLVAPATLISVVVLRQATRRLEGLTAATATLRTGNLGARVPVGGEDEVARLQADFNAMAADLEGAMRDLRAERDTVARLLQARRELVAAVSHELRTPLATLRAYLDSTLAAPGHPEAGAGAPPAPPPALRRDLEVMAGETVRLQRLIDDLFVLSRAEAGRLSLSPEPVDAGPLLERCAAGAAPLAWERGRVEVLAAPTAEGARVLADAGRLEQVVRNLVANAVRHTPPGGLVLLTAVAADGHVVIQVKDTGEGIPAEDLPRIWERFYRGANAREPDGGAGLGLALVKELTEAMGGEVRAESVAGEGSVFTLRLPAPRMTP